MLPAVIDPKDGSYKNTDQFPLNAIPFVDSTGEKFVNLASEPSPVSVPIDAPVVVTSETRSTLVELPDHENSGPFGCDTFKFLRLLDTFVHVINGRVPV
jgi:hypothetical protein